MGGLVLGEGATGQGMDFQGAHDTHEVRGVEPSGRRRVHRRQPEVQVACPVRLLLCEQGGPQGSIRGRRRTEAVEQGAEVEATPPGHYRQMSPPSDFGDGLVRFAQVSRSAVDFGGLRHVEEVMGRRGPLLGRGLG